MNLEEFERKDRRNYLRASIIVAEYARDLYLSKVPGDHAYSHRAGQHIARLAAELVDLGGDLRNLESRD